MTVYNVNYTIKSIDDISRDVCHGDMGVDKDAPISSADELEEFKQFIREYLYVENPNYKENFILFNSITKVN